MDEAPAGEEATLTTRPERWTHTHTHTERERERVRERGRGRRDREGGETEREERQRGRRDRERVRVETHGLEITLEITLEVAQGPKGRVVDGVAHTSAGVGAAVDREAEAAVDNLSPANAASIVQGDPCCPAGRVSDDILDRHIGRKA
jgi:hypothetical protein